MIKVFSSKNKEPTSKKDDDYYKDSKDKKSQDMIDTNVESDVECDSSLNINIKKEVDISKLVKKEENAGEIELYKGNNNKPKEYLDENGKIQL